MSSAVSPLVSVPRKTTSDVDYSAPIKQVISTTYGEPADRYTEEIASLNRARQDAVRGAAGSDMTARDLLYRYFGQLELLELRFPDLRVPFPWNDAFTPSKNISQLSLAYEKASVIFNIAATLSALAAAQNRSSPEGLKRAFNFYRSSAGMFTYINDNFLHAPSTDLGRDLIKVLVSLMTAQATEVFLERMNEEKRSPGLKSKICAQVAAVYAGMVEDVKENVSKGYFDRSWLVVVQTKAKYFASLAQYNRALADIAGSKHGDALARLAIAETNIKEAIRLSMTYGSSFYINAVASAASTLPTDAATSLQEMCKNLATLISESKNSAQKDNDLIYHAIVPSEASLPIIEKSANVAEPIPIQEIYATPEVQKLVGQDIFIKLVPLSVIESSSLYSEEKAKILRTEGERCDIADGELQAMLEHLGLPGNLAKFRATGAGTGNGDPMATMADPGGQVRAWSAEIKDSESYKRTDAYITELASLRDKATADLDYCSRELDSEQRECEQARVKYDYLFEQSPSAGHTRSWRTDIKNNREALGQARASDDQVFSLWSSVRDDVNALAAGDEVIEGIFSDTIARVEQNSGNSGRGRDLLDLDLPDEEGEQMNGRIASIQESLSRLSKLKKERNDVLADLKERVHNDDISQLLILNRKSQNVEPTLFAAELEKFRPHQARIQSTIALQQSTLQQTQNVYGQLTSGKKGKEIQDRFVKIERAKKDLIARYKRAHDAYLEVRTSITKGAEFYRDLAQLVGTLKSEVSQFVSARAAERSQMLSQAEMKQRMSNSSGPSASNTLDRSFGSMNLGQPSSPRSPVGQNQQPPRTFSSSSYPSIPPSQPSQPPQPSYSPYGGPPPPRPPTSTSTYSNGLGSAYPSSSTPSLPPKPSTQVNAPYRQTSISGLPPPPGQPHYTSHTPNAMPPPPSNLSYNSTYASPPSVQPSYLPPPPAHSSHSSPPPPPPQHPSHTGYSSYGQQPNLPPRPPPQAPSYSSYAPPPTSPSTYSSYTSPPQQQYHGSYSSQPEQAYGQQQYSAPPGLPQHQQQQYGQPPPPQHQYTQYSGQPQPPQPRY